METQIDVSDGNGGVVEVPVRLLGRKIHAIRGEVPKHIINGRASLIDTDDVWRDETGWYKILGVSEDCRHFSDSNVGDWIFIPEIGTGECYFVGPGERVIRETWFEKAGGPPLAVFKEVA